MPRTVSDIFLSSTSKDLQVYRNKVSDMIGRMGQTTIRMESFGAQPNKPLDTCRKEVEQCDALIVIVGHRYGWIPGKEEGGDAERSITWWEVAWALNAARPVPVYAFLIDPDSPWTEKREQDRLLEAKTEEEFVEVGHAVKRLREFREFLEKNTTRETFTSADDLAAKVATSLHNWLLRLAVEAVREAYPQTPAAQAPAVKTSVDVGHDPALANQIYWHEQVHVGSARRLAGGTNGVRIALVAGCANTDHPALSGAAVKHFDARLHPRESAPDDFTTAIAALLVAASSDMYRGMAPGSDLLVIQVLDEQYQSSPADVAAGLEVALKEGESQVVCIPLSVPQLSATHRSMFDRAAKAGITVVCPAGNSGRADREYPAAFPTCISAAAVDDQNRLASFSNFGEWVTTAAPAVDLPVAVGNEGYRNWAGTSFSCAIIAGIAAMMLKANPKLSPKQMKQILSEAGTPVATEGKSGRGLRVVNAWEAVQAALSAVKPAKNSPRKNSRSSSKR